MLIKCPECGHDVSDQTDKCPNCGFPIKKNLKHKAKANKSAAASDDQTETVTAASKQKPNLKRIIPITASILIVAVLIIVFAVPKSPASYEAFLPFLLTNSTDVDESERALKQAGYTHIEKQKIKNEVFIEEINAGETYTKFTFDNCSVFDKIPETCELVIDKWPELHFFFPDDRKESSYETGPIYQELLDKMTEKYGKPEMTSTSLIQLVLWHHNGLSISIMYYGELNEFSRIYISFGPLQ